MAKELQTLLRAGSGTKGEIVQALLKNAGDWFEGAEEDIRNFIYSIVDSLADAIGRGQDDRAQELRNQMKALMGTHKIRLKREGVDFLTDALWIILAAVLP